jgi:hypothetical protein
LNQGIFEDLTAPGFAEQLDMTEPSVAVDVDTFCLSNEEDGMIHPL